jgi:hypothetical protein
MVANTHLEAEVRLVLLGDLTHEALERELADQQLRRLLVLSDLTESDSARSVAVRLLDPPRGRGRLAGSLGRQVLAGSLASSGLARRLLGTGHVAVSTSARLPTGGKRMLVVIMAVVRKKATPSRMAQKDHEVASFVEVLLGGKTPDEALVRLSQLFSKVHLAVGIPSGGLTEPTDAAKLQSTSASDRVFSWDGVSTAAPHDKLTIRCCDCSKLDLVSLVPFRTDGLIVRCRLARRALRRTVETTPLCRWGEPSS